MAREKGPRRLLVDDVRDEIRARIKDGRFQAGTQIPPEAELGEILDVSRPTLREAIRGLVEEGYLARRHGSGTFVLERAKLHNNLDVNFGVTELIETMGMDAGARLIRVVTGPADEGVAVALSLRPGSSVLSVERVRTADGQPVVYSVEWIPGKLLRDPSVLDSLSGSLYRMLEEATTIKIHHGIAKITAVRASEVHSRALMIKRGAPLLYSAQVDYDQHDRPCIFSHEWYAPELIELQVYRRGTRA